jgi:hypothetical protein
MIVVGQIFKIGNKWFMLDEKKVEILKVWYSIFCVIMDDEKIEEDKIDKLIKLRKRLKDESPELEQMLKQMKN